MTIMMFMEGIDKFGRSLNPQEGEGNRGPPGIGFKLSEKGDYSLENKRLIKVAAPVDSEDATTRAWVEEHIKGLEVRLKENEKLAGVVKTAENEHYTYLNKKADNNYFAAMKKSEDIKSILEKNFQLRIEETKKETNGDLESTEASLREEIDAVKTEFSERLSQKERALRGEIQTSAQLEAQSVLGAELKSFAYAIHKKFEAFPTDLAHEANLIKILNNPRQDWRALLGERE